MADQNDSAGPQLFQRLFGDRQAFYERYQERRRAYDTLIDEVKRRREAFAAEEKQRREALEAALSDEISTSRSALAEVTLLRPDEAGDAPTRRAAYSDRMAAVMAKLSLLAYVEFEDPANREVLEATLQCGGFTLKETFAEQDTEAFVAECDHFVVLAFRGTTSPNDRKTDMRFSQNMTQVPGHKLKVNVHQGFYDAFHTIGPQAYAALMATPVDKPIYLTGHSLGGALALVASAAFSGENALGARIAAVYTYGAPRVGGKSFRDVVKAPHHRIVNKYDMVPQVPPSWMSGYRHTGDCMLLRHNRIKPVRAQLWASAIGLAIMSILLWPFGKGLLFLRVHDIARYVSRLDVIAERRGQWS